MKWRKRKEGWHWKTEEILHDIMEEKRNRNGRDHGWWSSTGVSRELQCCQLGGPQVAHGCSPSGMHIPLSPTLPSWLAVSLMHLLRACWAPLTAQGLGAGQVLWPIRACSNWPWKELRVLGYPLLWGYSSTGTHCSERLWSPSSEIFKSCLDMVLLSLLEEKHWTSWPSQVPSNLSHCLVVFLAPHNLNVFLSSSWWS